ncbi:MAG: M3 family oligoendopeptidase, partial [Chitinophagaceae bacterium]
LNRPLENNHEFKKWLSDMDELGSVISEDVCWRQIKHTCHTQDEMIKKDFEYFYTDIQPHIQPYADALNKKLIDSPFTKNLPQQIFFPFIRNVQQSIDLYREKNIPLFSELAILEQQYGSITSQMTVSIENKEYTMQQAAIFLENEDRTLREKVYLQLQERRLKDKEVLNELFTKLIRLRHRIALNAGFENYRDFRFAQLGRFDYTYQDCEKFHTTVQKHLLPLVNSIYEYKKQMLEVPDLKPWDLEAMPKNELPLKPFVEAKDLLEKTIECLNTTHPFFGDCLKKMKYLNHVDLESRKGKAPGGYNCPLAESGAPFIFMNTAGSMHDVVTLIHESGHMVHSFLAHQQPLGFFKEYPMEIAEVASMGMELLTMDKWQIYFKNKEDVSKAQIHLLERIICIFPWIAQVDKFQHWIYLHPDHTIEQREQKWIQLSQEFSSSVINQSGLEKFQGLGWQKQLHIYEVPFYYIEYGIAQLGAIGIWKNFTHNRQQVLQQYIEVLSLGNTTTLPKLYEIAGVEFDFSEKNILPLVHFIKDYLEALWKNKLGLKQ